MKALLEFLFFLLELFAFIVYVYLFMYGKHDTEDNEKERKFPQGTFPQKDVDNEEHTDN